MISAHCLLEVMIRYTLLAASLLIAPSAVRASCFTGDMVLVSPADGSTAVPVGTSLVVYGPLLGAAPEGIKVVLEEQGVGPVELEVSVTRQPGDYFMLVAKPDAIPRPLATFAYTIETGGLEMPPLTGSYTSGQDFLFGDNTRELFVDYLGLGVVMTDPDGSFCASANATDSACLAIQLDDDPWSELVWVEVATRVLLDSYETGGNEFEEPRTVEDWEYTTVFSTILAGADFWGHQIQLGSDECWAHFDIDPEQTYCVKASTISARGTVGWSASWSCSDRVGYWSCDGSVLFGSDIPEGMTIPFDNTGAPVDGEAQGDTLDSQSSESTPGSVDSLADDAAAPKSPATSGTSSGCSASATPTGHAFLPMLLAMLCLAGIGQSRRRKV